VDLLSGETITHVVEMAGIALVYFRNEAVKGIMSTVKEMVSGIKLEQAAVKAELLEHQDDSRNDLVEKFDELKSDFNDKHIENKDALQAHIIDDKEILGDIKVSVARIEARQKRSAS
jgi:hypothetical protein